MTLRPRTAPFPALTRSFVGMVVVVVVVVIDVINSTARRYLARTGPAGANARHRGGDVVEQSEDAFPHRSSSMWDTERAIALRE